MTLEPKPLVDDLHTPDLKTTVNAVVVKLPEFYQSNPASWFLRAEAQFGIRSISQDETKFWPVLTFSPSLWERAEHILAISDLGNRKPSALVNQILTWLSDHPAEILLQHVFLRALPHVQDALAGCDFADLESLGDRADEIMAHPHRPASPICSASLMDDPPMDYSPEDAPAGLCHLFKHDSNRTNLPPAGAPPASSASSTRSLNQPPAAAILHVPGSRKTPTQPLATSSCAGGPTHCPLHD